MQKRHRTFVLSQACLYLLVLVLPEYCHACGQSARGLGTVVHRAAHVGDCGNGDCGNHAPFFRASEDVDVTRDSVNHTVDAKDTDGSRCPCCDRHHPLEFFGGFTQPPEREFASEQHDSATGNQLLCTAPSGKTCGRPASGDSPYWRPSTTLHLRI